MNQSYKVKRLAPKYSIGGQHAIRKEDILIFDNCIGQGAYSKVFRAWDNDKGVHLAAKIYFQ